MKFLALLSTLLLTSLHLHAEDPPPLVPPFEFTGKMFSFAGVLNTGSRIYNTFRTTPPEIGDSAVEISTAILKTTDCGKFAGQHLAKVKRALPGCETISFNSNNATFAGFAHLRTDPKSGALNAEFWVLQRDARQPVAHVKILKLTDSAEGAREKMEKNFPATTEGILNSLDQAVLPETVLPRRRSRKVETMEKPEGPPVLINQKYIETSFAGRKDVPQLVSEFSFTIPQSFAESARPLAKLPIPYFVGYVYENESKETIESISFANLSHAMTEDTRPLLPALAMIMETQAVDPMVAKNTKIRFVDRYVTEFNGLPAAVIQTETVFPDRKSIVRQHVIIPRPGFTQGLVVETYVNTELSAEIDYPQHLWSSKGFANQTLASLTFLDSGQPAGK